MKGIISGLVALVFALCFAPAAEANVISQVSIPGYGTRYVDVIGVGPGQAQVWFRVYPNACSTGDRKAADLRATVQTLTSAWNSTCTWKPRIDLGLTLIGCGATAGAAICAGATAVPPASVPAAACAVLLGPGLPYAMRTCFDGVSSMVGQYLAGSMWQSYSIQTAINNSDWRAIISNAVDWACQNPN